MSHKQEYVNDDNKKRKSIYLFAESLHWLVKTLKNGLFSSFQFFFKVNPAEQVK